MKQPFNFYHNTVLLAGLKAAVALVILSTAATAEASSVVFDNISAGPSSITSTSSTPNTFMGDGYVLAPGTTAITGFDLYPVNLSGTNYTGLQLNIFVWGTVNTTGTVNAGSPAFSNLLGSYTFTETGTFSTGFYYPSSVTLGTALALSSTTIGLSFNYKGTTDGINYNNANNLTSLIRGDASGPSVGSQVFNGYYRNASSETNGNFTSTLRSLSLQNQSLAVEIYGESAPIPEPATFALIGLGGTALLGFRRRKHSSLT